ncbi:formin-binding protein 1 isoform X1 [Trichomycterus rosablanca]|uniref:formin-binding protein 1 isoform X1 n=1 Tax=Trichomycterus rosablanca TaxID=2290929 RepID=UPI002F35CAA0
MSWGTELWDQFDNLEKHTQWGIDFVERYTKFVKERSEIELNYAKQIRNLSKKYQPKKTSREEEESKYTWCRAFLVSLNELNDYAGQHELVAENMSSQIITELTKYSQELKTERKTQFNDGRKAQQQIENSWKQLEQCKRNYERACKEADRAQQYFEKMDGDINVTKADVEKARQQAQLRHHLASDSRNEYANYLQKFNQEQTEHYYTLIPNIFQKIQLMEEKRIERVGESMKTFAELDRQVLPIVGKCLDGITKAAESIEPKADSAQVVESYKSGFEPPGDVEFEDFSQPMKRTVSETSLTNSRSDPKTEKPGKSKSKLWPFKKNKGANPEDFSHLPPEQRRKKLQAKIEEINKDITKELDQRDALTKMKDVYIKNPQMGDPSSVDPRLAEIAQSIDKLQAELQKFEGWLAEVEGRMPARSDPTKRQSMVFETQNSTTATTTTTITTTTTTTNNNCAQDRESPDGSYTEEQSSEVQTKVQTDPEFDEFDDAEEEMLPTIGTCKALYPFEGTNEGTLALAEGEVLFVIEEDKGDGWTRVRRNEEEEGYVPTTYVEVFLDSNSKDS